MAYEFSSTGRTYNTKGEKTIFLRTGRSGDDKRKLTVQLTIFACGHRHADPLLIFKGAEGLGQRRRKEEMKKYHPGVKVMWNPKGYCNSRVMLKWFKEQYRHASPYSPDDREPRLLVLDAFAPHKNRGSKRKQSQSETAIAKSRAEEQIQQQIREEQAKLNVTLSIIPGGGTGYLQPLDIFFNRLLKALIREQEERWIENNLAKWEACNFTEGERRILITEWVGTAYDTLYEKYKDLIIQTFRNVGLSLNPDGSEDSELKIRDLPDIEVGDWTRQDEDILKWTVMEVSLTFDIESPANLLQKQMSTCNLRAYPLHFLHFLLRSEASELDQMRSIYHSRRARAGLSLKMRTFKLRTTMQLIQGMIQTVCLILTTNMSNIVRN
jgi:hypothetical protein